MGTGPDGDSGWEKVWRAAAWAQVGDSDTFYAELRVSTLLPVDPWNLLMGLQYALERNYASNLLSLYNPFELDAIFQFDANGGYSAALLVRILSF